MTNNSFFKKIGNIYVWIGKSVSLWVWDGCISYVSILRMQEHWLTEILSKKETMRENEDNKLKGKKNWKRKTQSDVESGEKWSI